ncbi:MAG: hypothetical protein IT163_10020 [Bryobacterales bacterium]|nr:hypothetical protein [Bryobacterales bacterium]
MRTLAFLMACALLETLAWGQEQAKPEAAKPEAAAEATVEAAKPEAAEESPEPVTGRNFTATIDAGARWVSDVSGDLRSYRSVVNLGEGPKLFGFEAGYNNPAAKLLNRLSLSARNWGGDPFSTLHLTAERSRWWRLSADYRSMLYYNFLPSFANPRVQQPGLTAPATGPDIYLNQRGYDQRRRTTDVEIELLPGRRITPFAGFSRNSGDGTGVTPFVASGNEYPVSTRLSDAANTYRGGVRIEMERFHATLEQGGISYKDDQSIFTRDRNLGNRTATVFGQTLFLANLDQAYAVRGESLYSKALVTASPLSWLHAFGQFLYSRPKTEVRYTADAQGLFVLGLSRFFNTGRTLLDSAANQPHTSASGGAEFQAGRLRVVNTFFTDRFHNAGSALLAETLFFSPTLTEATTAFATDRLIVNNHRYQVDGFYDVARRLTFRGGYRRVWGDASLRAGQVNPYGPRELGELRQNVGIAGINFRPVAGSSWNAEYEGSSADQVYFRTSLANYHRLRVRGRQPLHSTVLLGFNYYLLDNRNPFASESFRAATQWKSVSQAASLALQWTPKGGKFGSLIGEYTHSKLRSDLQYLAPQILGAEVSRYVEYGHTATALLDLAAPKNWFVGGPRIQLGGSFYIGSGSRPTHYYQPVVGLRLPLHDRVEWYADWRYYGFSQPTYLYEAFRTHMLASGLRIGL